MSEIDLFESKTERRRLTANLRLLAGVVVLAVAIAVGLIFVFRFADAEYDRDLRAWQLRMGIVAESRLEAVNEWVEAQYTGLQGLADNTAMKLYMTELSLSGGDIDEVTDEPAQRTYLRNLLVATADRTGFIGPPRPRRERQCRAGRSRRPGAGRRQWPNSRRHAGIPAGRRKAPCAPA